MSQPAHQPWVGLPHPEPFLLWAPAALCPLEVTMCWQLLGSAAFPGVPEVLLGALPARGLLWHPEATLSAQAEFGGCSGGSVPCWGLAGLAGCPCPLPQPSRVPAVLKKRLVKLVVNFLFYFRTDEAEPIGALLLEHCKITKEEENVFSISFIEEPERKYCFECATEEQCQEWVEALRRASYEFLRRSLIFYRNEIQKMTGKDPLEQYGISEEARFQLGAHRQ
ncbi:pleckstrin homology domain-containing family J member 1 [Passer montanus]|nr:pleckstrin homology domain-containing family J member 1 [Passer montanus]